MLLNDLLTILECMLKYNAFWLDDNTFVLAIDTPIGRLEFEHWLDDDSQHFNIVTEHSCENINKEITNELSLAIKNLALKIENNERSNYASKRTY